MNINPELRRYSWLEISPARLLGMVWVLGVGFYLSRLSDLKFDNEMTGNIALGLYCLLTMLWGTRLASESVFSEIRDHTWDFQRMSSLGPWSLAWGKLLGSTIYTWYGGLLCLLVFMVFPPEETPLYASTGKLIFFLVVVGLFAQAVALFAALLTICKERKITSSSSSVVFLLGGLSGLILFSMGWEEMSDEVFVWYDMYFAPGNFIILSGLLFLGWVLIGIYRLLCMELQVKKTPAVWGAFILFMMFYLAGCFEGGRFFDLAPLPDRLNVAFMTATVATYAALLSNKKDPVAFGKFLHAVRKKDFMAVLYATPPWLVSLGLVALSCCAILLVPGNVLALSPCFEDETPIAVGVFLFLLRDTGLLIYLNLAKNKKRADMLFVLNLCFLYGLFPLLASLFNLDRLTAAFWPSLDHPLYLVVIAIIPQILLVSWLVLNRWQRNHVIA